MEIVHAFVIIVLMSVAAFASGMKSPAASVQVALRQYRAAAVTRVTLQCFAAQFRESGISTTLRSQGNDDGRGSSPESNSNKHTPNHIDCPACEETRDSLMYTARFGEYPFPTAARLWLDTQRHRLSPKTIVAYETFIHSLSTFFELMPLRDIHIGHISVYQKSRQAQIRASKQHVASRRKYKDDGRVQRRTDGASHVNHEIACVMRQVLRCAGRWSEIEDFYHPLPVAREGPGIALTEEEEAHLFEVAASRPRWQVAYHCATISRVTGADPGEVLHLRLGDVDLASGRVHFAFTEQFGKNEFRDRYVMVMGRGLASLRWLHERALEAGACLPDHFLVPHRARRLGDPADPTRPMGSYKKAWSMLRRKAGKKYPRLLEVRIKDLRHTAVTKMLENPQLSYSTIEKQIGHRLGSRTKQKYEHIRDASLRQAAELLAGVPPSSPSPKPPQSVKTSAAPQAATGFGWSSTTFRG